MRQGHEIVQALRRVLVQFSHDVALIGHDRGDVDRVSLTYFAAGPLNRSLRSCGGIWASGRWPSTGAGTVPDTGAWTVNGTAWVAGAAGVALAEARGRGRSRRAGHGRAGCQDQQGCGHAVNRANTGIDVLLQETLLLSLRFESGDLGTIENLLHLPDTEDASEHDGDPDRITLQHAGLRDEGGQCPARKPMM